MGRPTYSVKFFAKVGTRERNRKSQWRFQMPTKEEFYDEAVDLYADGQYEKAIELYEKALAVDPSFSDAIHGLVMCYQAKGDLDGAIALTKRSIERDPEDILAFTNLSLFYQRKGMINEAETAAAEARRLDWKRQLKETKK
jgi:tetratricopeptide (TPR) repeat protein